jgi:hypothetical protein
MYHTSYPLKTFDARDEEALFGVPAQVGAEFQIIRRPWANCVLVMSTAKS